MISEKMEKMLAVINKYNADLPEKNYRFTSWFAPDIPEKELNKVVKNYDNHIAVNSIVAIYDASLTKSQKNGIIFTNDGVYFNDLFTKVHFINYADIDHFEEDKSSLKIYINNSEIECYTQDRKSVV